METHDQQVRKGISCMLCSWTSSCPGAVTPPHSDKVHQSFHVVPLCQLVTLQASSSSFPHPEMPCLMCENFSTPPLPSLS